MTLARVPAKAATLHPGDIFSGPPNLYNDSQFGLPAAKLLPGEYVVTRRPLLLTTVLGSCVSACLLDKTAGIGGMNHFMLPDGGDSSDIMSSTARYGSFAMEVLINEMLKAGARRHAIEAKVFGGGNVMRGMTHANVGQRNAEFVKTFLRLEGIAIRAEDLLDIYPRKVYFFSPDGKVLIRKLKDQLHDVAQGEQAYRTSLAKAPVAGNVELFGM